MPKKKNFQIKNITKKELEKHFNTPISNKEFRVIKYLALLDSDKAAFDPYKDDGKNIVPYDRRFEPFYDYILAIHYFGGDGTGIGKWSKKINKDRSRIQGCLEKMKRIREEIDRRYPKVKLKKDRLKDEVLTDDQKPIKEKPWRWQDIDPFFFIPNNAFGGFLILLFLTWLIFGVIFDIGPGSGPPRFFGHDGG
jgi:hypothetical protein